MTRKAETLKSLDELDFSARTRSYLERNFDSIDRIIMEGRIDAFEQDLGTQLKDKAPKWKQELVSSLNEEGFIRPTTDFLMTFRINALYCVVYEEWKEYFLTDIRQLSNEQYETFLGLSAQCIEEVKSSLQGRLFGKDYEVLSLRFGLDYTGISHDFESISSRLYITRERVRQHEAKALMRLRYHRTTLPAIFDAPSDVEETAEKLYAELEELYESPAFKRADEITWKLEHMRKSPFNYRCKYLKAGALDNTHIDKLNLTVRPYNCLMRAGITTIADIINFPKDDWFKVRNLGSKALKEVVEKMHAAGYKDFNIDIPSASHHHPVI